MIEIKRFASFLDELKTDVQGLEDYHLVAVDTHAVNRLKSKTGVQLVAVIPNAQRSGRVGASEDMNSSIFFVIEKANPSAARTAEIDQYDKTQQIIIEIRSIIEEAAEEGCWPFWRLEPGSITIDPEYNIFGGWNGWSMQFTF
ncbi:hypothetical protein [Mongoliitalea lutea]|uniref:Uncharacterized protein n=1 Tax=Mongoliitalea lutea TaxID=849756 RepID=A0A8J3G630_9BACT|nr:hypothetical protein [Mongoliitalea lutea]GHB44391.1 hypothetical protein GCM10008106_26820 [Mongoliitalea lutea]